VNISDQSLFRQQAFINGQWCDASNHETLPVSDPATGQLIGQVPNMAQPEAQHAIACAQQALAGWRSLPAQQRALHLRRWFELMLEHQQDLASLMTQEQGNRWQNRWAKSAMPLRLSSGSPNRQSAPTAISFLHPVLTSA
jgi:succinate-semialdehyde dehydrogenase / glutarate-semialdehyde dehydrogenase